VGLGPLSIPIVTVRLGLTLVLAATLVLGGCREIAITGDFRAPFEAEGVLMPRGTQSYRLAGPAGVRVDVGLDFEESENRADRMTLTVGSPGDERLGETVPGHGMRRAVCGITLSPHGVPVAVQNRNAVRTASYSIRVERSPSQFCQPRRVVPSTELVQSFL
jgi:hypothetical protein